MAVWMDRSLRDVMAMRSRFPARDRTAIQVCAVSSFAQSARAASTTFSVADSFRPQAADSSRLLRTPPAR